MSHPITIEFPSHVRGILVSHDDDGTVHTQDVPHGSSVLNIERDLFKHLSDQPYSDAWLTELRDYLTRRLDARDTARRDGYLIHPTEDGSHFVRVDSPRRLEVSDE